MNSDAQPFIPPPGTEEAERRRNAFGQWAQDYQRYRPGYPPELFRYLMERTGLPAQAQSVLDIGAGTGQLSRGFVAAGCEVRAVEPDDRMREILSQTPGLTEVLAGSAEELPRPDDSATIIAGAQMWHWVDESRALPEVARVLRVGGVIAIIWTLRDDRVDWVKQMHEAAGLPDSYSYFQDAEAPNLGDPFVAADLAEFRYSCPSSPDDLVGLVATFSHVGLSPEADKIKATVREVATTHPDLADSDTFDIPYVAKVFTAIRGG